MVSKTVAFIVNLAFESWVVAQNDGPSTLLTLELRWWTLIDDFCRRRRGERAEVYDG